VLLLPYLVVPALLAGVSSGAVAAITVSGSEMLGLLVVLALGGSSVSMQNGIELAAPWAVASLGAGLTGTWVVQLRGGGRAFERSDDASYESARRLLSQLRTVARRLSSGLDPISMASGILATTHEALQDSRSALFVRTEGGVLSPLGYRGFGAKQGLDAEGHIVKRCWDEAAPVHEPQASGLAERRWRIALPLRSGSRLIGVVVAESESAPSPKALEHLMTDLDEQSLRLDTALVFDEVRSLATLEERQRLAREIHDGVAQEIASLGYAVDDLTARARRGDKELPERLSALRSELTRVVQELRLSIFELRTEVANAGGLGAALSGYVQDIGASSGMRVHLSLDESAGRLHADAEAELLRIAQEAITNARKHAGATNLWVTAVVDPPQAVLRVEDDGAGLKAPRRDSFGLEIMDERARRLGAVLTIRPREPVGTTVEVTVGGYRDAARKETSAKGATS
jgi:signal transduction histidine kinase